VKAILINIFGGILRCDTLAKGLIDAASEIKLELSDCDPDGGDQCRHWPQDVNESGLKLIVARTMKEAAQKVIASIQR